MTSSSVPSTLVKCLYLFFDLPPIEENDEESTNAESEFSQKERRILLQKMFIQVKSHSQMTTSKFDPDLKLFFVMHNECFLHIRLCLHANAIFVTSFMDNLRNCCLLLHIYAIVPSLVK